MMQVASSHNLDTIFEENGFDLRLFAAWIWVESKGDPNAVSSAFATGLIQVVSRDNQSLCGLNKQTRCFTSRPSTQELKNPEFNLDYGVGLLEGYIAQEGSLREGMGRYYGCKVCGYVELIQWLAERINP